MPFRTHASSVDGQSSGTSRASTEFAAVRFPNKQAGIMSAVLEVSRRCSADWRVGASHGFAGIVVRLILPPPFLTPQTTTTIDSVRLTPSNHLHHHRHSKDNSSQTQSRQQDTTSLNSSSSTTPVLLNHKTPNQTLYTSHSFSITPITSNPQPTAQVTPPPHRSLPPSPH